MPRDPQLKSQRKPDVGTLTVAAGVVRFGDGSFPVLAGPGAVESEPQIVGAARQIRDAGGLVIRSATYLPPDIAGSFSPLGREGVLLLEHAASAVGIAASTFVFEPSEVATVVSHTDLIEIGPSRMRSSDVLSEAGRTGTTVIVHRGSEATVDDWVAAATTVTNAGGRVVLCDRGSEGHDPRTSGTVDISAVAVVQRLTDLPVLVNPAPLAGSLDLIAPLALAARSAGADGLMVAVHPHPDAARFRLGGHLDPAAFAELMEALGIPSLRDEIDRIDREILNLVARRLANSVDIGLIKAERGVPLHAPDREEELVADARADARAIGLDPDYAEDIMRVILDHSKRAQAAAVETERTET
ncbi:MAG: bifunctional 3-deoxy-7-phosphoheptulonate synthase/chorismate mutase type II [Acidimicrobiia bacterium]|nr:bifunctional 3-deoxy-7-phosphoheptulonate synthase/chorismate mutase type II [Acidimicrobiia bacterium]